MTSTLKPESALTLAPLDLTPGGPPPPGAWPSAPLSTATSPTGRPRTAAGVLLALDASVALMASALLPVTGTAGLRPAALDALVALLWVLLLAFNRAYVRRPTCFDVEDIRRVTRAGVGLAAALLVLTSVVGTQQQSIGLVVTVLAATASGIVLRLLGAAVRPRGRRRRRVRVVVAGHRRDVARVVEELTVSRNHDFHVVALCLPAGGGAAARGTDLGVPVSPGFGSLPEAVRTHRAQAVVVVPCRHFDPSAVRRLGWLLEKSETQLFVASGLFDVATARATVGHAGNLPLLHVRHADLTGVRRIAKEAWERAAALLALVVLAPLLLLLAVLVRAGSPGPALFRQTRIGRDGRPFTMLKLRTMTVDAEQRRLELVSLNQTDGALFKMRGDPRVTRLGHWLRRYSLDELPQLVNVLRGDMSLVGPRPPLVAEVATYDNDARRRLAVKPGLTGLWQVSGRSDLSWRATVRLDLRYVDNWSIGLDLLILCRTIRAVLGHRGAY